MNENDWYLYLLIFFLILVNTKKLNLLLNNVAKGDCHLFQELNNVYRLNDLALFLFTLCYTHYVILIVKNTEFYVKCYLQYLGKSKQSSINNSKNLQNDLCIDLKLTKCDILPLSSSFTRPVIFYLLGVHSKFYILVNY